MKSAQDIVQRIAMKALIIHEDKVLILREASAYDEGTNGGKYQLPGGRVEAGENFETALLREVQEETGLEVVIDYPVYVGEWRPVIREVPNQIVGVFLVCTPKNIEITLSGEHDDYQWIDPKNRAGYEILSPDFQAIDRYAAR